MSKRGPASFHLHDHLPEALVPTSERVQEGVADRDRVDRTNGRMDQQPELRPPIFAGVLDDLVIRRSTAKPPGNSSSSSSTTSVS